MQGPAPTRIADVAGAARTVGHDAAQAVRGMADAAAEIAHERTAPLSTRLGDAAHLAGEAADTARGLAADAGALARGTREAAVAQYERLSHGLSEGMRAAAAGGQRSVEAGVRAHPLRAALCAAAAGAVAAGLLRRALRGRRPR